MHYAGGRKRLIRDAEWNMAGRGERQRGGVIGEDRRSERGRGMGGGSSTAEEAQGHSPIPRRGRKTGEKDRIGGEKKGESNPDRGCGGESTD